LQFNLLASARLAQAAIPMLRNGGTITFISSITGVEATPAPLPYSAAKAALINYSKNLSRQVASLGIRVNCVAPGNILFPGGSWERRLTDDREAVLQRIQTEVPMARFGTPEEIAGLVTFLCSPRASFISGACFVADGGQTRSE
jgi:3-oxoacyl-[acyl-carrier protein] reductase